MILLRSFQEKINLNEYLKMNNLYYLVEERDWIQFQKYMFSKGCKWNSNGLYTELIDMVYNPSVVYAYDSNLSYSQFGKYQQVQFNSGKIITFNSREDKLKRILNEQ